MFEYEGEECVNIPITMDTILENDEQFIAVLRSQDSAVKLDRSSAVITFLDSNCRKICMFDMRAILMYFMSQL